MIPQTKNNQQAMICVSALQKCIRRGMEREAMEFAVELLHTSKAFCTMVCNRLEVISHEDIETSTQPHIVPFVATACEQAKRFYKTPENPAISRCAIGNAIRMMCRAKKSREGDHFQAAIGQQELLNNFIPQVPDFALDMHTLPGRQKNRGLEHFITEGAKLIPPAEPDAYQDEAEEMWKQKHAANVKKKTKRPEAEGQTSFQF